MKGVRDGSAAASPLGGTNDQLRHLALNAIMAEHFVHHASPEKLKMVVQGAVKVIGRDPSDPVSMHNGTCDLTEIPKMQQMFFVKIVCKALGFAPEIPDCEWLDVEYSEGVPDRTIATALGVLRDLKGVTIIFHKGQVDFQSLYRTGMYRPYGFNFDFISPD